MELALLITFTILLVATNGLTAYITFKAVQTGIKWQMQAKQGQEPVFKGPIASYQEKKEVKRQEEEVNKELQKQHQAINDWIGDPDYLTAYTQKREE
jgi:hypothetical protein